VAADEQRSDMPVSVSVSVLVLSKDNASVHVAVNVALYPIEQYTLN
jgi:hypothetical protein